MREILFRAKSINRDPNREYRTKYKNGDWVYGLITKLYNDIYKDILPAEMRDTDEVSGIEVDYKTIGEYIGLKDKNGKRIFEGDIITVPYVDPIFKSTWNYGFTKKAVVKFEDGLLYAEYIDSSEYGITLSDLEDCCEVIGNIHDNPGLFKEV